MKSHIVFGAGLIGCFLGGVFAAKKMNVSLVCRTRIKQKLSNGLSLTDYQGNSAQVEKLNVIDADALSQGIEIQACDFLWLTVKCTGVEQAAKDIAPLVNEHTVIFCCQNGLGSDQLVKQHYPNNIVLRVMVPFNVAELKEGHLHRGSEGDLTIERSSQRPEISSLILDLIDHKVMPSKESRDMQALLWAKLQLNLGNSVNALADIPVKNMLEQKHYRLVIAALMKELLTVTDGLGIELPKVTALSAHKIPKVLGLPNFIFRIVANKMLAIDPTVRTSMWWDLSQAKQTEIEHLNGAILKNAKQLGIDCPVNENIVELIHQMENEMQSNGHRSAIGAKDLLASVTATPSG